MKILAVLCPCGSKKNLDDCCQLIINGQKYAKTAEQLMRSRYSAYVLADAAYLMSSWHTTTRPSALPEISDKLKWTGLKIINTKRLALNKHKADVEFIASYLDSAQAGQIHENSHFIFEAGQWFYLDGEIIKNKKPGRNSACECGSGKKYKQCCYGKYVDN